MLSMRYNSHEEIGKHPKRMRKIKHLTNKCNWQGVNIYHKKMIGKSFRKVI